jgi:type VI secretion system secreted protein VgrG
MQPIRQHLMKLALVLALPVLLAGCDHDLDDCCTGPLTITYGPAGAPPPLAGAGGFCIFGGSGVTCAGTTTTVVGNVGCASGNVNGLPAGQPTGGSKHEADAVAASCQTACTNVYNDLGGRPSNATLSGVDLGGRTFTAGCYTYATTCQLTGTLTLDGQGNPNAVFVIQVGTSLTCAPNSAVVLINGAQAKHVFWQCGTNATLGNGCAFRGNLVAQSNIAMHQGASCKGRVLARNGTVSLDDNACELP